MEWRAVMPQLCILQPASRRIWKRWSKSWVVCLWVSLSPACYSIAIYLCLCVLYSHALIFIFFQSLIKDPKLSSIVLNPHVKRSIKQKTVNDALNKAKLSPITINFISEYLSLHTQEHWLTQVVFFLLMVGKLFKFTQIWVRKRS